MFTRNRCICLLAFLFFAMAPQNVFSQQTTHVLYGIVYSSTTGKPVLATVSIANCAFPQSTTTGADGTWRINYLYGQIGSISFSAPGYEIRTLELTSTPQWFYAGGTISLHPISN